MRLQPPEIANNRIITDAITSGELRISDLNYSRVYVNTTTTRDRTEIDNLTTSVAALNTEIATLDSMLSDILSRLTRLENSE